MMPEFRKNNVQNAQAMVEFALVLPILLLLILGVFAFGHLFFTYSLVVSSSREAARFGAAVGLTNNNLPGYRDCNEIRNAAVRVGSIAGVNAASVNVQYDQGVRVDGTTPIIYPHDCPIDGIGPGYVELGDRIVVTVSINYQPIVPIIQINEIPLVAETRRTIIMGMPVGDVTPAVPLCTGTIVRILPLPGKSLDAPFTDIMVGEPFSTRLEVISDDPDQAALGTVSLYFDDPTYTTHVCAGSASSVINCSVAPQLWMPAYYDVTVPHILRAKYDPGSNVAPANPCFNPSLAEPMVIVLQPAPTITNILSVEVVNTPDGDLVRVEVQVIVDPESLGGGIPTGPVDISDTYGNKCVATITEPNGTGYCDLDMEYGYNTITAVYNPVGNPDINPNYLSSSDTDNYDYNTPTPTSTPTIITPDATMLVTQSIPATDTPEPPAKDTPVPTVVLPPG